MKGTGCNIRVFIHSSFQLLAVNHPPDSKHCRDGDTHSPAFPSIIARETGGKLCVGCLGQGWLDRCSGILEDLSCRLPESEGQTGKHGDDSFPRERVLQEKAAGQGLWINSPNVEES